MPAQPSSASFSAGSKEPAREAVPVGLAEPPRLLPAALLDVPTADDAPPDDPAARCSIFAGTKSHVWTNMQGEAHAGLRLRP